MGLQRDASWYDDIYANSHPESPYYFPYHRTPWMRVWNRIATLIEKRIGNHKRILEIACGVGQFAEFLHDRNLTNYFGFDFSATAVEAGKKRMARFHAEDKLFVVDAFQFDFENENYEIVVAGEFFEHINEDLEIVTRIKKGTYILATLPNRDSAGHVRWFDNDFLLAREQIKKRYESLCEIIKVENWPHSSIETDYLLVMKRR